MNGHSGQGIVIVSTLDELAEVDAPLYVEYVPKKYEYRVHVFNQSVLDVQRKMRNPDVLPEDCNWQVRNHSNGFIYGREGVALPYNATQLCIDAVSSLGLDFGAVDLIWNERRNEYYVLEVNTAPGLFGTTLELYASAISEYYNEYI